MRWDHNPGRAAGAFRTRPRGIILHGSRSGRPQSVQAEYDGTRRFATQTDLGWNVTLGEYAVAEHMGIGQWGWNARAASGRYLAVEFAQPTVQDAITDGQVAAFVAWYREVVVPAWGEYPIDADHCPTHAELEARGETGAWDGKSDVFPAGDWRADELRARIAAALAEEAEDVSRIHELEQELAAERAWGSALLVEIGKWADTLDAARQARHWTPVREVAATMHAHAVEAH